MPRRPRWTTPLALIAAALGLAASTHAQVVISQVNGNGGFAGDLFDRDFVELFNKGTTPVSLAGWSLQMDSDFGGSTPESPNPWTVFPLSGTIQPGQYLLVVTVSSRGVTTASAPLNATPPLPPADLQGRPFPNEFNLSQNGNFVALMSTTTPMAPNVCPPGQPGYVDFVHYGAANALCFEGSGPAVGPSATGVPKAIKRLGDGCQDTNDNAADFQTGVDATPRNSAVNAFVSSTFNITKVTNGPSATTVRLQVTRGSSPCNPVTSTLTSATADLSAFGGSATQVLFDNGTAGDQAAGDGVFSFEFNVPGTQAAGRYAVPVTAGNGTVTLGVSAVLWVFPTPAPDSCASAFPLSGTGVIFNGFVNSSEATADVDGGSATTCNMDSESKYGVWFAYTPPSTGAIRVDETSSEDITVALFDSCGGAPIHCRGFDQERYLPVVGGTPLWILVANESAATVAPQTPLNLKLTFEPGPANTDACTATIIPADGSTFHTTPNAAGAPAILPGFNVSCDQGQNPPEPRRGVWYVVTAPVGGRLVATEDSGNFSVFTYFSATTCSSGFVERLCLGENDADLGYPMVPGETVYVLVSLSTFSSIPFEPYNIDFTFVPAPANDTACTAQALTTFPQTVNINPAGASDDPGTSSSDSCSGSATRRYGIWYTYTAGPTETGALRVSDASANDLYYISYTGADCSSLTPYQCYGLFTNDDIFITLQPGQTYWILVSPTSTTATTTINGSYQLLFEKLPVPTNDTACGATLITTATSEIVNGPAATADIDVSCNYNNPVQTSTGYAVWYKFQPATSKLLRVQNTGSDVLVYGLFQGPNCSNLAEVNCRQGNVNQLTTDNTAYYNLIGGQTYYLLTGKIATGRPISFYNLSFQLNDPNGACCAGTTCTITTQATCTGNFRGAFTTCGEVPNFEDTAPGAIPDSSNTAGATPGVITRTINATGPGSVNDLKLLVDLTHPRLGQLIITLTAPNGASLDIIRRIDDDNDANCPNFGIQGRLTPLNGVYIFDDQAYTPEGPAFDQAGKYFDSSNLFIPSGHYGTARCDLTYPSINAAFAGSPIAGTWTLSVSDNQINSTGTLNRWGLIINGGATPPCNATCQADFDQNGTRTIDDIFIFINAWFANDPRTDVNGDGRNIDDIFIFLNIWFQGCP